ncbi:MAG: hypothetical protein COV67_13905 [Nitrospinae bacterium CG11_big_fil_rev_8_21_14_0_20_56_8]|nr:MAG: hypothetical protein COV67_13905 [Nitrospinae bacterium CG11_big_fil_rev_8_21_14_0_20_56_8]
MIRKLNFTGRKKIPRNQVSVTLMDPDKHPCSFDVQLDLSGLNLPPDGLVYVEAYKRTSYMRFPFGKVNQLQIPAPRLLDKIEAGVIPLFRVKVVEAARPHGRIVALAEKIIPKGADRDSKEKITLVHVEFSENLGDQIWRLDLTGDWPSLQVNNRIEGIREIARSDPAFISLVYPEMVRQILNHIIFKSGESDPDADGDDWPGLWIRFASSLPGVGSPPGSPDGDDKKIEWIEEAVGAFCEKHGFLDQYKKLLGNGQSE